MAKIKKGILGPIHGNLGPITGSTWKGIPYVKPRYNPDLSKKEPSAAQKLHHAKFAFITKWLRPIHHFVTVGFQNEANEKTEINAAFSYNFKHALLLNDGVLAIDYPKVKISTGQLSNLKDPICIRLNQQELKLEWETDYKLFCTPTDQLILLLYNDQLSLVDGIIGGIKRSASSLLFKINNRLWEHEFHVYVGVFSINGNDVADSEYLGKIHAV